MPRHSSRRLHRGRHRQALRLGLEFLERRDCPAVMFEFSGGILDITGDEEPNVIEFSQAPSGVVEVVGDGERRTFEGVDEIFVATGDGNDVVEGSVTGRIGAVVVDPSDSGVGLILHVNAGAGDDKVKIVDGEPTRRPRPEQTRQISIIQDLGSGSDLSITALNNHSNVSLDVLSSDGGDRVAIGMLLPAVQKVRAASARIEVELGGSGNVVQGSTKNLDDVELSIVGASPARSAAPHALVAGHFLSAADQNQRGGTVPSGTVTFSVDGVSRAAAGGDVIFVQSKGLDLVSVDVNTAGGSDSIWIDIDAPIRSAAEAKARILTGDGADRVRLTTSNVDRLEFYAETGAGDDTVHATVIPSVTDLIIDSFNPVIAITGGEGNDNIVVETRGLGHLHLRLDAGAGDDTVVVDAQTFQPFGGFAGGVRVASGDVELGEGNDKAEIKTRGYSNVTLSLTAGDGNDSVTVDSFYGQGVSKSTDSGATWNVNLGAGDDRFAINTAGYAVVTSWIDAGGGDDAVNVRHRMFAIVDRTSLRLTVLLGAGNDTLVVETMGYQKISTSFNTGPADDGLDRVSSSHQALRRSGRLDRRRLSLDRGRDVYEHHAVGYAVQSTSVGIVAVEYLFIA